MTSVYRFKMEEHRDRTDKKAEVSGSLIWAVLMPLSFLYLEGVLQATGTVMNGSAHLGGIIPIALGTGLVMEALTGMVRSGKWRNALRTVITEAAVIWFLIAYFSDNAYRAFMDPASIAGGARGVVTEFSDTLLTIVTAGAPMILLYHMPLFVCVLTGFALKQERTRRISISATALLAGILAVCAGVQVFHADAAIRAKLTTDYNYDTCVRNTGLLVSTALDLRYGAFGNPYGTVFVPDEEIPEESPESGEVPEKPHAGNPVAAAPEYGTNEMDTDLLSLMEKTDNADLKKIYAYLASRKPSMQNEYTGIFEGKNLILICAEAFSKEVIDPVRTPVLYRLATKGIVFEDYYQPTWGGSTSSGEFSFLTGIIPVDAVSSVFSVSGHDLRFTMGNQLKAKGYYTAGYHDGEYTYYDRHKTHPWFGYDNWMGRGNGMEKGCPFTWPESDEDMFRYTVPMYLEEDHFNIYYMTVSGHANYSLDANAMSGRNWDTVKDLDYSYAVRCYLAANQELEKGMAYLVSALEEAGKADDTVIVLTADHYPYGLEDSTAWATSGDCLADLYGFEADCHPARDHSALIIWCGCLEKEDPIIVSDPTYSLDILPTLSNLFGLEYDSRFLVGRDVLSSEMPLVIWPDRSWMTVRGYYDGVKNVFTPADGAEVNDAYIDSVKGIVQNRFAYSRAFHRWDLLDLVFGGEEGSS